MQKTIVGIVCAAAAAAGCSGYFDPGDVLVPPTDSTSSGEDMPPPVERCDAPTLVFQKSCDGPACHGAGSPFGGFADPESVESLVGATGIQGPDCGAFIDPETPEASLILTRVTGETLCGAPSNMPLGRAALSDEEVACLEDWLQQFAE